MDEKAELNRRRSVLSSHLGHDVMAKRGFLKPKDPLVGMRGEVVAVKRTRVLLNFRDGGEWWLPILRVLMPFSSEPAPGQMELF